MKYKAEVTTGKGTIVFGGEIFSISNNFLQKLESLGFQGDTEAVEAKITSLPRDERRFRVKVLHPDNFEAEKKTFFKAYKNRNLQGGIFRWLLLSQIEGDITGIPTETYERVSLETFLARIGQWIKVCNNFLDEWI